MRRIVLLAWIFAWRVPVCAGAVCNPNDVRGPYALFLSGETTISGEPKPVASVARVVLADQGILSGYSSTMFAGFLQGNPVKGTYEVRPDCTMTWSLQDDSGAFQHFSGQVAADGKRGEFRQTDPGGAQNGTMACTADACAAAGLGRKFDVTLSGNSVPMSPGEASSAVSAQGRMEADDHGNYQLVIPGKPGVGVTIRFEPGCIVLMGLTLPGTAAPTNLRGLIVNGGKEILAIQTDPGFMVSARFHAR